MILNYSVIHYAGYDCIRANYVRDYGCDDDYGCSGDCGYDHGFVNHGFNLNNIRLGFRLAVNRRYHISFDPKESLVLIGLGVISLDLGPGKTMRSFELFKWIIKFDCIVNFIKNY